MVAISQARPYQNIAHKVHQGSEHIYLWDLSITPRRRSLLRIMYHRAYGVEIKQDMREQSPSGNVVTVRIGARDKIVASRGHGARRRHRRDKRASCA